MNYLVTGGAGFIGHHLHHALIVAGHQVCVLDDLSSGRTDNLHPDAQFIEGCITDAEACRAALEGCDGVFHLAAIASVQQCQDDWPRAHAVNSGGFVTLLDAIKARPIPVVYASSAAVYGDADALPINETSPRIPFSAYGADKLNNEHHAAVASAIFSIPTLGLRPFNVYGPQQDPSSPYSGVISIFMQRALAGKALTIFGDGSATRDFVYVADAVQAFFAGMKALETRTVSCDVCNLGTGQSVSIQELADTISRLTDSSATIDHQPARAGDIAHSCSDPSYAAKQLGFTTTTSLDTGLTQLKEALT